jgi:Ca2+-transporting ATPase
MITGDHPKTAEAIAREMGILQPGEDPGEVVHARATPEDKLKVVRAWKAKGAVVAMTGDGVNDAPALKEAHIGIAMGKAGTEVTREASDMVLADDNFASIVAAVREGRGIYENIQKTLVYLLAGNFGELLLMLGASAFGLPIPLLPLQLLWINLVTDGLPALALVMDPADPELLERPPRPLQEHILGRAQWRTIAWVGGLEAALSLGVFAWALRTRDLPHARNLAFSVVVFAEVLRALASRSATRTYWEVGAWSNARLIAVVLVSTGLQLVIHWVPALHPLFDISPMSLEEIAATAGLGVIPATALELSKLLSRRRGTARSQKHSAPPA